MTTVVPGQPPTEREIEVITLISDGHPNAEIATRLGISVDTVKTHVVRVRRKTGTRDRAHLACTALRAGWIK